MNPLLAQGRLEQVLSSTVVGLGLALIAMGSMALLARRPPEVVEGEPSEPARSGRISKPVAVLLILIGLGVAGAAVAWRLTLPL